jgi:plastocyanin
VSWLAIVLAAAVVAASGHHKPHHRVGAAQRVASRAPQHRGALRQRPVATNPLPSASPVPIIPGATATPTPTATATPGLPSRTGVSLTDTPDYTLLSSYRTLKAGEVSFLAVDYGMDDHNLTVQNEAKQDLGKIDLPADKETYELDLNLPPGTYRLYCSLANHAQLGMQETITVR